MAARSAQVRKVVTIVFTDVVDSTALGEGLDQETLQHVLSRYFEVVQATLERHGGTVEKFIGDAVMAVFGIPTLHEDDALRAVRAAVDMRAALDHLNDELESRYGVRIETRTGVNTGEVVSGDGALEQKLATGDAINVASRLEQAAGAGEILIGRETHRLVRGAVEVEPLSPLTAKGKSEPLPAWRVEDLVAGVPTSVRSPFIGRKAELATLRALFASAARDRSCALATIVGPPGIGKTRLAAELARVLGHSQIAMGRCLAYGEAVTYAPVAEIVGQITTNSPGLLAGEEDAAAIERRIGAAVGPSDLTASPEEIAWAFRRLLETAGRERPLVVVVDDIHWAEPVLFDLLEYVVGFSSASPMLLLCLARPDLFDVRPSWAMPRSNKTLVSLEPLTDEDSRLLIEHLAPGRQLRDDAQAEIVAAAEGFPLFVEQMLALHADDPQDEIVVPASIHALLAARIDRLEQSERDVLTRASVEGRVFHRRAVAELLPADARAGVSAHLLSLVRKQFLRPDRARFLGDDGFRFSHVLIRDVAYRSIPKQLRARLHEQYGRWLEQQESQRPDEHVEIVGFHLEQAWRYSTELGSASDALAHEAGGRLWAAARDASRRMDIFSAIGLYDRAVALLPDEPTGELLRELAAMLNRTEDRARARLLGDRAIELSRLAGNRSGELRARLDRLWMPPGGSELRDAARIRREVEEAIPQLEALQDYAGLTNAWQLMAISESDAGQHGKALRALQDALRYARLLGDRLEESEARVFMLERVRDGPMPVGEAIGWCEQELQDHRGDWMVEMGALRCSAVLYAMRGSFDLAKDQLARSTTPNDEFEFWAGRRRAYNVASIEMLAGNHAAAERALRDASTNAAYAAYEAWWGMGFFTRASIAATLCAQGRFDEALTLTEALPAKPGDWVVPHTIWRSARARALAGLGRPDEAVVLAREAVERSDPTDDLNLRGDALLAQADVLRACGRDAEAKQSATAAKELYERKGNLVMAERAATFAP
jgi:class 3 adenylate cyclase/tetratricopeptide (TPR) repeat protein